VIGPGPASLVVLGVAVVAQAAVPTRRLLIVAAGAAVACVLASTSGTATTASLLAAVPWDVLLILVSLGLLTEVVASTRVFSRLAVGAAGWSRGDPRRLIVLFALVMYVASGFVNNLTALFLVLPVLLKLMSLLGVSQRYASWTLGTLLVACNLGGAATPIGDFPAILLLGAGRMGFEEYLGAAAPPTLVALAALLGIVALVVRPARDTPRDDVAARLSLRLLHDLHRRVRVERGRLLVLCVVGAGMLAAWILLPPAWGVGPELVCWVGAGVALALRPAAGELLLRRRVDVEAALFLLCLFVMVGAVQASGVFDDVARAIEGLDTSKEVRLAAFLATAGVLTGLLSAGPSMAALLPVADRFAATSPPAAVYVGLALAVCAGSSLFLTAATAGPLAQVLTERAGIRDAAGSPVRFGFAQFLPTGLLSFALILGVAIAWALLVGL
jgi:Na+/H+ antiporter NhaD/arsenite permease-like protein